MAILASNSPVVEQQGRGWSAKVPVLVFILLQFGIFLAFSYTKSPTTVTKQWVKVFTAADWPVGQSQFTATSTGETGIGFRPGLQHGPCVAKGYTFSTHIVAPVVIVAYNRPDYLNRTLQSVLEVHRSDPSNVAKFPLFVSQDSDNTGVEDLVWEYMQQGVSHLQLQRDNLPVDPIVPPKSGYHLLAEHFGFLLRTFFDCFGAQRLIILEDDMLLAPDFFSYFEATAPLLDEDESLMCVSAWNDNGQHWYAKDPLRLERSDFFPGYGWLLNARVWDSFRDIWPEAYWDDVIRHNKIRQNRQCIRPEVCRTYNIGANGTSGGIVFKSFLEPTRLNDQNIHWPDIDLSYLQPKAFDARIMSELKEAKLVELPEQALKANENVVLLYNDTMTDFTTLGKTLKVMTGINVQPNEPNEGVLRASYKGIVTLRTENGNLLFVAPRELYIELTT